jgi:geranylgeranyl diphosphate synthase type II
MYNQVQLKDFVERAIASLSYNTEAEKLNDPVRYVMSIGGKRLRPVLTLMACNLFNDKVDNAVFPATGIEVFHNFTLVHDDIIDNAPVRRGFPTVHSKWNVNQAVLSGDVMAFIANDCFLQTPQRCMAEVFRIFNKAAIEVCVGQQMDIDFEKTNQVSQAEYLRMIELKTAVLLAASAKIGALIGGAGEKDAEFIYEFGLNLGLAFQIQDDLLDTYGNASVFGKKTGGDIVSNKKTILLVKALEMASPTQLKKLHELIDNENDPEEKVRKVVEIYDQLNLRQTTETLAVEYIRSAFRYLEMADAPKERKQELTELVNTLVGREK